jgi:hypothetical protein
MVTLSVEEEKSNPVKSIIMFIVISIIIVIAFMFLFRGCREMGHHRHAEGGTHVPVQNIRA